jgi:hypothetical protein
LIISTRRFDSPLSSPTDSVRSKPSRWRTPETKVLGESNRKRLATRAVRNDLVVARK